MNGQRDSLALQSALELTALGLLLATFVSSCNVRNAPPPPVLPGDIVTLKVGGRSVRAELAFDEPSRRHGLMERESLPDDHGMLFLHPDKAVRSFWMKDVPIALSIAFISDNGTILQISHMEPYDEGHTVSKNEVRYALEMSQGWFRKAGVGVGDRIENFETIVHRVPVR